MRNIEIANDVLGHGPMARGVGRRNRRHGEAVISQSTTSRPREIAGIHASGESDQQAAPAAQIVKKRALFVLELWAQGMHRVRVKALRDEVKRVPHKGRIRVPGSLPPARSQLC